MKYRNLRFANIIIDDYFAIHHRNLHATSLCAEPRLRRWSFLVYRRLLWLCSREGHLPVCMH